ncbi:hypothetical protein CAPTEDRAFT_218812 [Capitella teleta]|uniref:Uncharacterized protein n=1 Tax=Capitella teleta TaxID=283909 RepID=R7U7Q8_CAPTE|nr:hypothetical protein CAPTEDRAFT_218812 [Capitella teleta]|eukprot:ELU02186.1 hypothetical protein CAPTEDRAFT_218812 [Capitella teleta]
MRDGRPLRRLHQTLLRLLCGGGGGGDGRGGDCGAVRRRRWRPAFAHCLLCLTVLTAECIQPMCAHPCKSDYEVCNAVLQVGSNLIEDNPKGERPYCECSDTNACPKRWSNRTGQTLTWFHHERRDWLVQYQFCSDVIERGPQCTMTTEVVITVKTEQSLWRPELKHIHCHCPDHIYYLQSWRLNSTGQEWYYSYNCYRRNCKLKEPCVKHYLDRGGSRTMGYHFLCSCPHGQHCPIGNKDQRIQSYEVDDSDDIGPFISGYCEDVPGLQSNNRKSFTYESREPIRDSIDKS